MARRGKKPHVIINMAMSADGKISSYKRESFQLGSEKDKELMNLLRCRSDAVIIGSGTLRVDGFPLMVRDKSLIRKREAARMSLQPLNVLLSNSMEIPLGRKFFRSPDTGKIVFTTKHADKKMIEKVAKLAEVVVLPGKTVSPALVLSHLTSRGLRRILLEGGGEVNYSFIKAGLVDEMYITVTPWIIGGTRAPTVVDGHGFSRKNMPPLKLISARRFGDELFLRYKVLSD